MVGLFVHLDQPHEGVFVEEKDSPSNEFAST
jgi:hypothetical protein